MNGTLIVNGESMDVRIVRDTVALDMARGYRVMDSCHDFMVTLYDLERDTQLEYGHNAIPRIELHLDASVSDDVIAALIADGWPVCP